MAHKPIVLIILDGFGYSPEKEYNAIAQADAPHLHAWFREYPHALLKASGGTVGLLDDEMGNSEVGHLTIGAGRVIPQPISFIHQAISDKSFFKNEQLNSCLQKLKKNNGVLHIMGLLSDGGVHSDAEHLYAFLDAAHQHKLKHVYIHAFLDGRDVPPRSARMYLEQLDNALMMFEYGSLGSMHGRFYAMDRDRNWDRTKKSYDILTSTQQSDPISWEQILDQNYNNGITDEFIAPVRLDPTSGIQDGDGIIFFNFRPDRARQLTAACINPEFDAFKRTKINLSFFLTPVSYGPAFSTNMMFQTKAVTKTLKEILSQHGKTIFSIAETEKYAHITYFFGGGQEKEFPGETQILIPSLGLQNYAENPCMSAPAITKTVLHSLNHDPRDFYLINYANADMVGHSGNMQATIKAIECLDRELSRLYEQIIIRMDGIMIITADHGKAESMYDSATKQPRTAHTNNPVPFILLTKKAPAHLKLPLQELSDVAPFILKQMGIERLQRAKN